MRIGTAKHLSFVIVMVILGVLLSTLMAATAMAKNNRDGEKTTICHATNSAKNPYVMITVDNSAIDGDKKNDHSHHTGPVFDSAVHNQQNRGWGDIIPPVEGVNPGQNWTAQGQAVYNNGCKAADVTPTPTPTPTPKLNPTPTPTPSTPSTGTPVVPDTAMASAEGSSTPVVLLGLLALLSAGAFIVTRGIASKRS